jgi:hypothetical protein
MVVEAGRGRVVGFSLLGRKVEAVPSEYSCEHSYEFLLRRWDCLCADSGEIDRYIKRPVSFTQWE